MFQFPTLWTMGVLSYFIHDNVYACICICSYKIDKRKFKIKWMWYYNIYPIFFSFENFTFLDWFVYTRLQYIQVINSYTTFRIFNNNLYIFMLKYMRTNYSFIYTLFSFYCSGFNVRIYFFFRVHQNSCDYYYYY